MAKSLELNDLLTHGEWVRRVVRGLVFDPHQVDDVVQQTWLAALRTRPEGLESPKGWLRQVARHFAFESARKAVRRRRAEPVVARAESERAADEIAHRLELHRRLVEAVAALDTPYRTVVGLRYFEDLAPREIAARLSLPVTTVRNRLSRALAQLRERFDAEFGDRRTWSLAMLPLALPASAPVSAASVAGATLLGIGGWLLIGLATAWLAMQAIDPMSVPPTSPTPTAAARPATSSPGLQVDPSTAVVSPQAPDSRRADGAEVAGETRTTTITGHVTTAAGTPLLGVRVLVAEAGDARRARDDWFANAERTFVAPTALAETSTDGDGAFSLARVPTGRHRIVARLLGYSIGMRDVRVVAGAALAPVDLKLDRTDTVPCIVLDDDAQPLGGVHVAIHSNGAGDYAFDAPWTDHSVTGPDGTFDLDLQAGYVSDARLLLLDRFSGGRLPTRQRVSLRKPGFADVVSAFLMQRPFDEQGRAILTMKRGRRITLAFEPRSGDGAPPPIRFMLRVGRLGWEKVVVSDESGHAMVADVPEDEVLKVVLDTPGWVAERTSAMHNRDPAFCGATFDVPAATDATVRVPIHRGGSARGIVIDAETGEGVGDVDVAAFPRPNYVAAQSTVSRTRTAPDGTFVLTSLIDGWSEFGVTAPDWIAIAGPETAALPLETATESRRGSPDPVVRRRGDELRLRILATRDYTPPALVIPVVHRASVAGRVVDPAGVPLPGASVSWREDLDAVASWPSEIGDASRAKVARTDGDGRFTLTGVPSTLDVSLLVAMPEHATIKLPAMRLDPGVQADVGAITLPVGEPLIVKVTDPSGAPLSGVGVKAYGGGALRGFRVCGDHEGRTDAAGRVTIWSLPPGPARIAVESVRALDLVPPRALLSAVNVDPTHAQEIAIAMQRLHAIRGVVRMQDGGVLDAASILLVPQRATADDVAAFEAMAAPMTVDRTRPRLMEQVRLLCGTRARTDARGEFTASVDAERPYVVHVIERYGSGNQAGVKRFKVVQAEPMQPGDRQWTVVVAPMGPE